MPKSSSSRHLPLHSLHSCFLSSNKQLSHHFPSSNLFSILILSQHGLLDHCSLHHFLYYHLLSLHHLSLNFLSLHILSPHSVYPILQTGERWAFLCAKIRAYSGRKDGQNTSFSVQLRRSEHYAVLLIKIFASRTMC